MRREFDVAIIGAGIAGASMAYFLAPHARVVLLEAETLPGYHTTGRSAAFWVATYGGPLVEPLTSASRSFFETPPPEFGDGSLFAPRGGLHVAPPGDTGVIDRLAAEFAASGLRFERLDAAALATRFPILREGWAHDALYEPDSFDIDVARLHEGFLAAARRAGAVLMTDAEVGEATRTSGDWVLNTRSGNVRAPIVINAAGAWGDAVALLAGAEPLGLQPLRRTMAVIETSPAPPPDLPVVIDACGSFYFKPDAGRIWVSPHDEIADVARDVRPEDIDVATAIDRFETAARPAVRRLERSWAGLRTFAPDRLPVYGFDPELPGFFWCVGQGGFGIQTAPAAGALAAALLLGRPIPNELVDGRVDPQRYSPARFRVRGSGAPRAL